MNNLRNKVQLIGKLGRNPELRELANGQKMARVSIATIDVYKNQKDEKVIETQWHNLIAFGKVAENMEVFLKKGNEVAIMGRLRHSSYEDKEGITRKATSVQVSEFMLLHQQASTKATKEEKQAEPAF